MQLRTTAKASCTVLFRLLAMLPILLCLASPAVGDEFSRGHLIVSRVEYLGDPNNFNLPGFGGV